jgi:hypothetical protein
MEERKNVCKGKYPLPLFEKWIFHNGQLVHDVKQV